MQVKDLIKQYLHEGRMMQLATVAGDQPWICTVYYMCDQDLNLYWLSFPERRHSQEVVKHPKVAAAIPIKFDTQPVIGLQLEGSVQLVQDAETVKRVMEGYTAKYNAGKDFYRNFIDGSNKHQLYKLTPQLFVLFDEKHFPQNGRQEWRP